MKALSQDLRSFRQQNKKESINLYPRIHMLSTNQTYQLCLPYGLVVHGNPLDCQGEIKVYIKNAWHLISWKQVRRHTVFELNGSSFSLLVLNRVSATELVPCNLNTLFREQCLPSAQAKWQWPSSCFLYAPET